VRLTPSALRGPIVISAERISIVPNPLPLAYRQVSHATVCVHVPGNAPSGVYRGEIEAEELPYLWLTLLVHVVPKESPEVGAPEMEPPPGPVVVAPVDLE
jgi:hypothetical protein